MHLFFAIQCIQGHVIMLIKRLLFAEFVMSHSNQAG